RWSANGRAVGNPRTDRRAGRGRRRAVVGPLRDAHAIIEVLAAPSPWAGTGPGRRARVRSGQLAPLPDPSAVGVPGSGWRCGASLRGCPTGIPTGVSHDRDEVVG